MATCYKCGLDAGEEFCTGPNGEPFCENCYVESLRSQEVLPPQWESKPTTSHRVVVAAEKVSPPAVKKSVAAVGKAVNSLPEPKPSEPLSDTPNATQKLWLAASVALGLAVGYLAAEEGHASDGVALALGLICTVLGALALGGCLLIYRALGHY